MAFLGLKHLVLSGAMTAFAITTVGSASPITFTPSSPISDYWNLDDGKGEQVEPKLAANDSGQLLVIWTLQSYGNILAAKSYDNGVTWTAPATIYTGNANPLSVHSTGNGWVAQWTREANDGYSMEHLVSRSIDGNSWTAPEVMETGIMHYFYGNYSLGDAESDGANTLLTTFGPRIARSVDGGQNWTTV